MRASTTPPPPLTADQIALVERYAPDLDAICHSKSFARMTRLYADPADAVGVASVALVKAARSFKPELGNRFVTLLWAVIHNELSAGLSSAHYSNGHDLARFPPNYKGSRFTVASTLGDGERLLLDRESSDMESDEHEVLRRGLERLSASDCELIRARFERGETLATIGQARGITRERVRQLSNRAINRLREACQPVELTEAYRRVG